MAKISACVIVKNEADNISRCLQSVKDIAAEMIVVDTGSTDDTVKIARQMGAKVFQYQWNNDFAAARNYALTQAKGDWIIFLDADEYILPGKIQNVRPFIDKIHGNRMIESVVCRMENTEGVDGPLKSTNPTVRIFRNSRVIRYQGKVHEQIYKHGKPTRSIGDAKQFIVICHTGYTKEAIPEKIKRNTIMLEEDLNNGNVRNLTYYYLSDAYWRLGQYEKAIEFAQKAIDHGGVFHTLYAYKPYVTLIASMVRLNTYSNEAMEAIRDQAIQKFPHHPEVLLHQALYYRKTGRYRQALESFFQSIAANERYGDINLNNDFYGLVSVVYLNIAKLYDMMNENVPAFDYYVKTLQQDRYNQEAFNGLMLLIRTQNAADVVCLMNRLYNMDDEADVDFLVVELSRLKMKKVLDYYCKIRFERFGRREPAGILLLTNGRFEQAFQGFAAFFRETGDQGAELLAVVSLLLGGSPSWVDLLGPQLRPAFQRIITAFFAPEEGCVLAAEDFSSYLELTNDFIHLIHLGNENQLIAFLHVGKRFLLAEAPVQIGDILARKKLFHHALDMYLYKIDAVFSEAGPSESIYCKAGFCCYKLKDFAAAANFFSHALECGYVMYDIFEYLEWSYQQCNDGVIKGKFKALKDFYGNETEAMAEIKQHAG
ncbi:MAG TPA: glycosyltransferase [Methylomusa anaerophila]|uniref:SPBc2 prophage-derived glycosyltransferase SunS n=1 Tax=Methylomusa anaerophila TaxID=1930071 RepID=A0A348AH71_9FIRM|nr:glycosyltransferase [Methylomusa anaerophila]BBB90419.1 SPBc2 prophage-derived glycosyltransferase SunS [Methylomusa anaerophila]HML90366.1 glycosyltransferase [Methylomusa anaerophila]